MAVAENTNNKEMMDFIRNAISEQLKSLISERYDKVKEQFLQNLEKEKAMMVSAVSLDIAKRIDLHTNGQQLVITLIKQ